MVVVSGVFGRIPENMIGGLAVITGFGMLLGPLGDRLPIISKIGGGALLCLMVPSVLVYFGVFNATILNATNALMKQADFLYFVIASLVVGSILGTRRAAMLAALVRIFPPLAAGTAAAIAAGLAVATLLGHSPHEAFFFLVVPVIGGGIGEGVMPLSAAYAHVLGGETADYVARLIPAAVIGNITALVAAGLCAASATAARTWTAAANWSNQGGAIQSAGRSTMLWNPARPPHRATAPVSW